MVEFLFHLEILFLQKEGSILTSHKTPLQGKNTSKDPDRTMMILIGQQVVQAVSLPLQQDIFQAALQDQKRGA